MLSEITLRSERVPFLFYQMILMPRWSRGKHLLFDILVVYPTRCLFKVQANVFFFFLLHWWPNLVRGTVPFLASWQWNLYVSCPHRSDNWKLNMAQTLNLFDYFKHAVHWIFLHSSSTSSFSNWTIYCLTGLG